MSKNKKNKIEQFEELLIATLEEMQNINTALYVAATEAIEISEKIDSVITKIDEMIEANKTMISQTEELKAKTEEENKKVEAAKVETPMIFEAGKTKEKAKGAE